MHFNNLISDSLLVSEKFDLYDSSETVEVGIVLYEYFFYFILILTNLFFIGILSVVLLTKNKNRTKIYKQSTKKYRIYY